MAKKPKKATEAESTIVDGVDIALLAPQHFAMMLSYHLDPKDAECIMHMTERLWETSAQVEVPADEETGEEDLVEGEGDEEPTAEEGEEVAAEDDGAEEGEGETAEGDGEEPAAEEEEAEEEAEEETEAAEGDGEGLVEGDETAAEGDGEEPAAEEEAEEPKPRKRAAKKPAKATKKATAAKKPAKKSSGKKKAEAADGITFADLGVDSKKVSKAVKDLGDQKPAAVLKGLGIHMPAGIKAGGAAVQKDFAASCVAASVIWTNKLGKAGDTAAAEKLAEKHGIDITYGRVRKPDAKIAVAVSMLVAAAAANAA